MHIIPISKIMQLCFFFQIFLVFLTEKGLGKVFSRPFLYENKMWLLHFGDDGIGCLHGACYVVAYMVFAHKSVDTGV